jgi:5-oxoprolinase (ATP-hydrolysing)
MTRVFDFAIDRGGTFTDVVCQVSTGTDAETVVLKLLSENPSTYADAPTEGIRRVLNMFLEQKIAYGDKIPTADIKSIRMGTTVATNALLERKGDRVALLITKGMRDVLKIGN